MEISLGTWEKCGFLRGKMGDFTGNLGKMWIFKRKNGRFHWEPGKNVDFQEEKWEISLGTWEKWGFLREKMGDFTGNLGKMGIFKRKNGRFH